MKAQDFDDIADKMVELRAMTEKRSQLSAWRDSHLRHVKVGFSTGSDGTKERFDIEVILPSDAVARCVIDWLDDRIKELTTELKKLGVSF